MTGRRKTLFVSLDIPGRTGSGSVVRSFHFLRMLSRENDVDLLILQPLHDADSRALGQVCQRVIFPNADDAYKCSIWSQIAKCLLFPFANDLLPLDDCLLRIKRSLEFGKNRPLTNLILLASRWSLGTLKAVGERLGFDAPSICSKYFSSLEKCVPAIIEGAGTPTRYDLIWFEHTVSFPLIKYLTKKVTADHFVCNSHNVEHLLAMQLEKNTANGVSEAAKTKQTEIRCLQSVDLTLTCSLADKEEFKKLHKKANIAVAPNGVELSYFEKSSSRFHDGFTLLFTGAISYHPNLEGVNYFIHEILPLIKAQEPRTRLIVAGKSADLIQESVDIEVVANPEDMRIQFCRATIVIVPLKSGGGTRLKILEAMAMGLPVVSTTIGAEGVGYRNGRDLLLADTPEQFSKAVIDLIRDPSKQQRLSNAGRSFVEKSFDWDAITSTAWQHIEEHCPKGSMH
jgi:glycosyltransferase involved in cell wall biosynthesis